MATSKILNIPKLIEKGYEQNKSIAAGDAADVSGDIPSGYTKCRPMGNISINGSNYAKFNVMQVWVASGKIHALVQNISNSSQTLSSFSVSFLCY